jgi:hypothetical protein
MKNSIPSGRKKWIDRIINLGYKDGYNSIMNVHLLGSDYPRKRKKCWLEDRLFYGFR